MAQIQKYVEKSKDLTVITVTGKVTSGEVIEALDDFYWSGFTLSLIWDFSGAKRDLERDRGTSHSPRHLQVREVSEELAGAVERTIASG